MKQMQSLNESLSPLPWEATVLRRDRVFEVKSQTDGRVSLQTRSSGQMFPLTRLVGGCRRHVEDMRAFSKASRL
jgi:hypothetical protein